MQVGFDNVWILGERKSLPGEDLRVPDLVKVNLLLPFSLLFATDSRPTDFWGNTIHNHLFLGNVWV